MYVKFYKVLLGRIQMVGEVFDPRREARPNPQSHKCAWMYTRVAQSNCSIMVFW
jgi:hypothetical protein